MASVYSVGQINAYIKNMFNQDFLLNRVSVRGEASNVKYHPSGHIYFTLKDGSGTLAAVMFAGKRRGLLFPMKEGQQIVVSGSVSIYEPQGKYQLYAETITLDGVGDLYARFEALKMTLEEMGMFAEEYKKPIPAFVRRLGVVTAKSGAAVRDILNITARRNPYVQVYLYSAQVQGEGAAASVVRGIETLDELGLDCLIVGRGGGSLEDLWAFNEESVARAIFNCDTPIISAVGHETDTTIADYVADLRAPTPSAAAELAVFDYEAFVQGLREKEMRLRKDMRYRVAAEWARLEQATFRLRGFQPEARIRELRMGLAEKEDRLRMRLEQKIRLRRYHVALAAERLEGMSPLKRLQSGFAYTEDLAGKRVAGAKHLQAGDRLRVHYQDGQALVRVEEVTRREHFRIEESHSEAVSEGADLRAERHREES